MQSKAKTIKEYLEELPEDRRKQIKKVRAVIKKNLPKGYKEVMNWGMISYEVPLKEYPDTYNKKPLMYAALASQKNHMSLYVMCIYATEKRRELFKKAFEKEGKKLNMGRGCVRFKKVEDIPLKVIGKEIARVPMKKYIKDVKDIMDKRKKR